MPVTETIKYGGPDRDLQIEIYKESLRNLGKEGVRTVCYNFMPILDWARTDLEYPNPDGTSNLYFNNAEFAYFDINILQREGARNDYPADVINRMEAMGRLTPEKRATAYRKYNNQDPGICKRQLFGGRLRPRRQIPRFAETL